MSSRGAPAWLSTLARRATCYRAQLPSLATNKTCEAARQ